MEIRGLLCLQVTFRVVHPDKYSIRLLFSGHNLATAILVHSKVISIHRVLQGVFITRWKENAYPDTLGESCLLLAPDASVEEEAYRRPMFASEDGTTMRVVRPLRHRRRRA